MADRIILHIDMDYFFAQIEERDSPHFRGKAVVVGADPERGRGRGVVSTANYVARKYGIHSALPISTAYRLCPEAIFLPVDMEKYQEVSGRIMEIVKSHSPIYEIGGLDEAYLDISFANDHSKAEELAMTLKKEILEKEKLTATIGIGPNKMIAKIAAKKAKPDGLMAITLEKAEQFLEPLDIEDLPGIGPKTAEKFRVAGINIVKDLKKLSLSDLKNMFGVVGEYFYERARGRDDSEVSFEGEIKSTGRDHTFSADTRDPQLIFKVFDDLIKDVSGELSENKFSFKTITVICRFTGFETHTKSLTLKKHTKDFRILKKESKKLLLKFMLENPKLIRLIGVRVSSFK